MNRRSTRFELSKLALCTICTAGALLTVAADSKADKLAAVNSGAAGKVEKVEQLSADAVAALGKKDGVGDAQVAGVIQARGFSDEGKTSVLSCATPMEVAAKASAGNGRELRGSVRGSAFLGARKIKRVKAKTANAGGKDRRTAAPEGFATTKKGSK